MSTPSFDAVAEFVIVQVETILEVASVNIDDDLFELGGDSLDAIELVEHIDAEYGHINGLAGIYSMTSLRQVVNVVINGVNDDA